MAGPSSHGADDLAASSRRLHARFIRCRMLLRKYWWVVAFGVALGTGIAAWMVASQKQIYMSQARMMVSGKINLPEGGSFSEEMTHFMNTQGELMKDEAIRTRAEAYVRTTAAEIPVSMVKKQKKDYIYFIHAGNSPDTYDIPRKIHKRCSDPNNHDVVARVQELVDTDPLSQ